MANRGRTTTEQAAALHEAIRAKLRFHLRNDEIREALAREHPDNPAFSLSRRSLYRHLKQLREEDREWGEEQLAGAFMSSYRLALESIENQIRELVVIRAAAKGAMEKIKATELVANLELEIINLLAEGPTVWALKRRAEAKALGERPTQ